MRGKIYFRFVTERRWESMARTKAMTESDDATRLRWTRRSITRDEAALRLIFSANA